MNVLLVRKLAEDLFGGHMCQAHNAADRRVAPRLRLAEADKRLSRQHMYWLVFPPVVVNPFLDKGELMYHG